MPKRKTSLFELERKAPKSRASPARRRVTKKTELVSIEQALHGGKGNAHLVRSQTFDTGKAISVQTAHGSFPMYPQQMSATEESQSLSSAFAGYDPYFVESFDEPPPAAPNTAAAPSAEATPAPFPELVTPEPHCTPAAAPAAARPSPPDVISRKDLAEDESSFEDDIKKILEKQAQQPSKPAPPEPILQKPAEMQPNPPEEAGDGAKAEQASAANPHDVFDSMAAAMGNATTFDLGSMSLNQRFDAIENSIESDEIRKTQKSLSDGFYDAAALDDAEMLADLSAVSSLLEEKLHEEQPKKVAPPPATDTAATPVADAPPVAGLTPPPVSGAPLPATVSPAAPAQPTAAPGADTFDVAYTVPAAQATDGVSTQATAAAMLVAWRDQNTIDMQALLQGAGKWAAYTPGLKTTGPVFFSTWGLKAMEPAPLILQQLQPLLKQFGPLWLQNPAVESTVRVISGVSGDGSPGGTTISVIDPAADVHNAQQKTNISALIAQLGAGPVRVAYLAT